MTDAEQAAARGQAEQADFDRVCRLASRALDKHREEGQARLNQLLTDLADEREGRHTGPVLSIKEKRRRITAATLARAKASTLTRNIEGNAA